MAALKHPEIDGPTPAFLPDAWLDVYGNPITCDQKKAALYHVWMEAWQACQDALDDMLLMGCSEQQAQEVAVKLAESMVPSVKPREPGVG